MSMSDAVKIAKGKAGKITVAFPYSPAYVAKIKAIAGRRWHPEEKHWTVPHSKAVIEKIQSIFAEETIEIDPSLKSSRPTVRKRTVQNEIIESAEKELKLRGYSRMTRKTYLNHLRHFLSYVGKDPRQTGEAEIREYLLFLIDKKRVSRTYQNQAISAIKFLYGRVLKLPKAIGDVPRPRRERRLPLVLSREEVLQLLSCVINLKHKAALMLGYSAGAGG